MSTYINFGMYHVPNCWLIFCLCLLELGIKGWMRKKLVIGTRTNTILCSRYDGLKLSKGFLLPSLNGFELRKTCKIEREREKEIYQILVVMWDALSK